MSPNYSFTFYLLYLIEDCEGVENSYAAGKVRRGASTQQGFVLFYFTENDNDKNNLRFPVYPNNIAKYRINWHHFNCFTIGLKWDNQVLLSAFENLFRWFWFWRASLLNNPQAGSSWGPLLTLTIDFYPVFVVQASQVCGEQIQPASGSKIEGCSVS